MNDPSPPLCPRETGQQIPREPPPTPMIIGYDLASPNSELTAISWPPGHPPTLTEFAQFAGYELQPYQRQLLEMLDKQLKHGRT